MLVTSKLQSAVSSRGEEAQTGAEGAFVPKHPGCRVEPHLICVESPLMPLSMLQHAAATLPLAGRRFYVCVCGCLPLRPSSDQVGTAPVKCLPVRAPWQLTSQYASEN